MATTYVDYTATAAQTDFAFTFPYLEDEHVVVEIDGVATTAFSIVTTPSTKIVLDSGATAGQKVRVRRKSQPDTDLVDFENGSVLTESELDRAYLHNRYLNEEISELNDASLQKAVGSDDWDAKNQKLTNLADPTEAQDAATKNYVDTQDALQVTKTGDSMSGALAMGSNKITGLGTPTLTDDAATKTYVDAKVNQVSSGASSPPPKYVFTGTAGANTTYSVTGAEVNGDTAYDVSIDGAVQEPTTDFTVDPDTDILTIIPTLSGGEDIVVIERGFGIAVSDGVVGEDQLQTNSVSTSKIQNDAVDGTKIADDSIDSEHYVDESIDTAHLADHSVTAIKISNTDPIFNVQTTGEVGIGTSSPDSNMHIEGGGGLVVTKIKNTTSGDASVKLENTVGQIAIANQDGKLNIIDNTSGSPEERMTVDTSGNIGINTSSPSGLLSIFKQAGVGTDIISQRWSHSEENYPNKWGLSLIQKHIAGNISYTFSQDHGTNTSDVLSFADGKVGIGTGTDTPVAPLEVASTTGGVVFPRLTTTQRDDISSPTDGETIFNTTTNQVESWNGSSWGATGGAGATLQAKASFQGVTSVTRNTNAESNIASVTRTGSGQYTVTFTSAVTDPVVSMSVARLNGTFRDRDHYLLKDSGGSTVYSGSVASIDINTQDAGGPRDAELIQLLVF